MHLFFHVEQEIPGVPVARDQRPVHIDQRRDHPFAERFKQVVAVQRGLVLQGRHQGVHVTVRIEPHRHVDLVFQSGGGLGVVPAIRTEPFHGELPQVIKNHPMHALLLYLFRFFYRESLQRVFT